MRKNAILLFSILMFLTACASQSQSDKALEIVKDNIPNGSVRSVSSTWDNYIGTSGEISWESFTPSGESSDDIKVVELNATIEEVKVLVQYTVNVGAEIFQMTYIEIDDEPVSEVELYTFLQEDTYPDRLQFIDKESSIVDIDEIVTQFENHPFYIDNEEFMENVSSYSRNLISSYEAEEIDAFEFREESRLLVEDLNDYYFDGQLDIIEPIAISTMLFSEDIRLGILALEFYEIQEIEFLLELITFDLHYTEQFIGMSVGEVREYINDFFSKSHLNDLS